MGSCFIYQLTLHFVSQFHPSSIQMMIHSCTFISQNKNKSHTCKDWTQRKHKNSGANDILWLYFNLFFAGVLGLLFSSPPRPLFLWSSPLLLQNLHYHRPCKQPPSMLYIDYIHVILLPSSTWYLQLMFSSQ